MCLWLRASLGAVWNRVGTRVVRTRVTCTVEQDHFLCETVPTVPVHTIITINQRAPQGRQQKSRPQPRPGGGGWCAIMWTCTQSTRQRRRTARGPRGPGPGGRAISSMTYDTRAAQAARRAGAGRPTVAFQPFSFIFLTSRDLLLSGGGGGRFYAGAGGAQMWTCTEHTPAQAHSVGPGGRGPGAELSAL